MNKKYDEVMGHIEVTQEMRQRILEHVGQTGLPKGASEKIIRFPYIKQFAALTACLVIVLVGVLVLPRIYQDPDEPEVLAPEDGIVQVFSVGELEEKVGFEIPELSGLPFPVQEVVYTAYWQELAEAAYCGEGKTVVYRKGIGSGDVSGDYNIYESETEIFVDGIAVTLKGGEGKYILAVWTDGEYAYSVSFSQAMEENSWKKFFNENDL
ncbi:MAG: hypothetical protein NC121_17965 [Blautia sp.]|nr:hypothetical protein [Muribaculaceae bacterium]MCM1543127.1 hypothetical protein [Blautia sp.]